jgi:hypothetical protein
MKKREDVEYVNDIVRCLQGNIETYNERIEHQKEGVEEATKRLESIRRKDDVWEYESIQLLRSYLLESIEELERAKLFELSYINQATYLAKVLGVE